MLPLTARRPTPESNDDNRSLHRRSPAANPGLPLGSEGRVSIRIGGWMPEATSLRLAQGASDEDQSRLIANGVPNFVPASKNSLHAKKESTKAESMCRGSREAICKKRVNQQTSLLSCQHVSMGKTAVIGAYHVRAITSCSDELVLQPGLGQHCAKVNQH